MEDSGSEEEGPGEGGSGDDSEYSGEDEAEEEEEEEEEEELARASSDDEIAGKKKPSKPRKDKVAEDPEAGLKKQMAARAARLSNPAEARLHRRAALDPTSTTLSIHSMAYYGGVDLGGTRKLRRLLHEKKFASPAGRVRAGIRAARAQLFRACALLEHASELAVAVLPMATGAFHLPTGLEARELVRSKAQQLVATGGQQQVLAGGSGGQSASQASMESASLEAPMPLQGSSGSTSSSNGQSAAAPAPAPGASGTEAQSQADPIQLTEGPYRLERAQAAAIQRERNLLHSSWCAVLALFLPPPRGSELAQRRGAPWIQGSPACLDAAAWAVHRGLNKSGAGRVRRKHKAFSPGMVGVSEFEEHLGDAEKGLDPEDGLHKQPSLWRKKFPSGLRKEVDLERNKHTVATDSRQEVHVSSLSVLADLAEAWAAGLLVDTALAARCARLVICSLTQIESINDEEARMDAAEVLACAYCWPHRKRGPLATASACLAARRAVVGACSRSLQQVVPRMLDCVLVNLGEGGEELILTTGMRDVRQWRNAIARVWHKASRIHRRKSAKGRGSASASAAGGASAHGIAAGRKRTLSQRDEDDEELPKQAAAVPRTPPAPRFPQPPAGGRSPSKQRRNPSSLMLSSFPAEILRTLGNKLSVVEKYKSRLPRDRKAAIDRRAHEQAKRAADRVAAPPPSSEKAGPASHRVVPLPTRRTTPHWFLREDWEVSWTPDQGHGTSDRTRLGKLWTKPQSAAVGIVRRCTTGGDAIAACHGALPQSEFYYAPCDDMGPTERLVLTMTAIADGLALLLSSLGQVICEGAPLEHAEVINDKKLQPPLSSLPWYAKQHASAAAASTVAASQQRKSSPGAPDSTAPPSSGPSSQTSSSSISSPPRGSAAGQPAARGKTGARYPQELRVRVKSYLPNDWRAAAARHLWGCLSRPLEELKQKVLRSAFRHRLMGRGTIHPAVQAACAGIRRLRDTIRHSCAMDGKGMPAVLPVAAAQPRAPAHSASGGGASKPKAKASQVRSSAAPASGASKAPTSVRVKKEPNEQPPPSKKPRVTVSSQSAVKEAGVSVEVLAAAAAAQASSEARWGAPVQGNGRGPPKQEAQQKLPPQGGIQGPVIEISSDSDSDIEHVG